MQILALIIDGFRESRDRRIFWVMLVLSLVVAATMFCIKFESGYVDVMFGAWRLDTSSFSDPSGLLTDRIAAVLVDGIMDTALGSIGMLLAIIATAGFLPGMMERGAIEVLVSKPLPRWKLFLGRYLGAVSFVLFHAFVFVGLTFLVAGVRWRVWIPGYLLSIPLIALLFSYLYCVSALAAVYTRGAIAAVLITLGAWTVFTAIQSADDMINTDLAATQRASWQQALHVARQIVPKTQDVLHVAKRWSHASSSVEIIPAQARESDAESIQQAARAEAARAKIPAYQTIGSSLIFECLVLAMAIWRFSRKDF